METNAHNWSVAYKAEKMEALQKQLDAAVAGEDRQGCHDRSDQGRPRVWGHRPNPSPASRKEEEMDPQVLNRSYGSSGVGKK